MQNMSAMPSMTFFAAWQRLYKVEVHHLSSGIGLKHEALPLERMVQAAISTALAVDAMNINM